LLVYKTFFAYFLITARNNNIDSMPKLGGDRCDLELREIKTCMYDEAIASATVSTGKLQRDITLDTALFK
jgi:hypothetical protein